jgi:hypothetical protein
LATTGLLTLLNFSSRLVSLDSHLPYFFFREQEKGECAEARSEKDDLKLCLFLLVNVSFSQFVLGLIYPQSTVFLQKKIMMSVWLSC